MYSNTYFLLYFSCYVCHNSTLHLKFWHHKWKGGSTPCMMPTCRNSKLSSVRAGRSWLPDTALDLALQVQHYIWHDGKFLLMYRHMPCYPWAPHSSTSLTPGTALDIPSKYCPKNQVMGEPFRSGALWSDEHACVPRHSWAVHSLSADCCPMLTALFSRMLYKTFNWCWYWCWRCHCSLHGYFHGPA